MKLALLFVLVACGKDNPPAPTAVDTALVEPMRKFCELDKTPFDERGLALAKWADEAKGNAKFDAVWAAMTKGDKDASLKIHAAADVAVGKGKCAMLESYGKP